MTRPVPRRVAESRPLESTPIFDDLSMRRAAQVDDQLELMPPEEIEHTHGDTFDPPYRLTMIRDEGDRYGLIASPHHSSRGGKKVRLLIVHTAEGARTVESLGAFFAKESSKVSSHAGIDDKRIETYVPYELAAWTCRSANAISDQVELCGFSNWTREQWLNDHHTMLGLLANWLKERSAVRGIPLRKLTPEQVAAGESGVCAHVDWTLGMKDGTHTDCGSQFPWDVVMKLATGSPAPEVPAARPLMDVLPWTLPGGSNMQQTIPIPIFPPYNKAQRAELWMVTGWEDAQISAMYFVRDRGPGISSAAEQWGGTQEWTLVRDDRPGFDLGEGCTSVAIVYSSPRPIQCLVRYTP